MKSWECALVFYIIFLDKIVVKFAPPLQEGLRFSCMCNYRPSILIYHRVSRPTPKHFFFVFLNSKAFNQMFIEYYQLMVDVELWSLHLAVGPGVGPFPSLKVFFIINLLYVFPIIKFTENRWFAQILRTTRVCTYACSFCCIITNYN